MKHPKQLRSYCEKMLKRGLAAPLIVEQGIKVFGKDFNIPVGTVVSWKYRMARRDWADRFCGRTI